MPSEQTLDLGKLAIERCVRAFHSVAQLTEDGRQTYAVAMMVVASMLALAQDIVQDGMEKQNGERPDDAAALGQVIGDLLDGMGVEWKAQKAPSNSRTRSKEK